MQHTCAEASLADTVLPTWLEDAPRGLPDSARPGPSRRRASQRLSRALLRNGCLSSAAAVGRRSASLSTHSATNCAACARSSAHLLETLSPELTALLITGVCVKAQKPHHCLHADAKLSILKIFGEGYAQCAGWPHSLDKQFSQQARAVTAARLLLAHRLRRNTVVYGGQRHGPADAQPAGAWGHRACCAERACSEYLWGLCSVYDSSVGGSPCTVRSTMLVSEWCANGTLLRAQRAFSKAGAETQADHARV